MSARHGGGEWKVSKCFFPFRWQAVYHAVHIGLRIPCDIFQTELRTWTHGKSWSSCSYISRQLESTVSWEPPTPSLHFRGAEAEPLPALVDPDTRVFSEQELPESVQVENLRNLTPVTAQDCQFYLSCSPYLWVMQENNILLPLLVCDALQKNPDPHGEWGREQAYSPFFFFEPHDLSMEFHKHLWMVDIACYLEWPRVDCFRFLMLSHMNSKCNFIFLRKLFLKTMNIISACGLSKLLNFQMLSPS